MKYYDIESCEIITQEQLFSEFIENKKTLPDEFNYTFQEYIRNCLTSNNGTLEIIKQ